MVQGRARQDFVNGSDEVVGGLPRPVVGSPIQKPIAAIGQEPGNPSGH